MKKGFGEKVLGWFVVEETDGAGPEAPARATPAGLAPPAPEPAAAAAAHAPAPTRAAATGDVLRDAGVPDDARERIARVGALVAQLPADAPAPLASVIASSLEAFGVRVEDIVVSGEGALAALDTYAAASRARTDEELARGTARVDELTAEIARVRAAMDARRAANERLESAVAAERERVRVAIAFFRPAPSDARPKLRRLG